MDTSIKNITTSKEITTKIIYIISSIIYIASIIIGLISYNKQIISESDIKQILIQNLIGFSIPLLIEFGVKIFKLRMKSIIKISIIIFVFFHVLLGETLKFYENVEWWDSFLHISTGFYLAFVFFLLLLNITKEFNISTKIIICVFVSIMFSITLAFIWEIIEYVVDSLFGTNMQRFIPNNELYNGGYSNLILNGTDEEIANFFRSPEGYRYALMDTMKDLLLCLFGNLISGLLIYLLVRFNKTKKLENIIIYIPKEESN